MRYTATSVTASEQYVTVWFTAEHATWMKFGFCKFPVEWLLGDQIVEAMDKAHRRELIEKWSGVDLADPLF